MVIAGFVLSIVSLILAFNIFSFPTSFICALLAFIFSIIGYKKEDDKGKVKASIIMSVISLIINITLLFLTYKGILCFVDNLPKLMEETFEYLENEKELFLNDILNQMEQLLP